MSEGATVSSRDEDVHRARCRCDWVGPIRSTRDAAWEDARRHDAHDAWCYLRALRLERQINAALERP